MTMYYDKMINDLRAEHAARLDTLHDELTRLRLHVAAMASALGERGIDVVPAGRVQCVRCGKLVDPSTTMAAGHGPICAAGCDKL
jgi:hypothetical protein